MLKKTDDRYPFTYGYDYLREKLGSKGIIDPSLILSRGDCAVVVGIIAEATGVKISYLAEKLANAYIERENTR